MPFFCLPQTIYHAIFNIARGSFLKIAGKQWKSPAAIRRKSKHARFCGAQVSGVREWHVPQTLKTFYTETFCSVHTIYGDESISGIWFFDLVPIHLDFRMNEFFVICIL